METVNLDGRRYGLLETLPFVFTTNRLHEDAVGIVDEDLSEVVRSEDLIVRRIGTGQELVLQLRNEEDLVDEVLELLAEFVLHRFDAEDATVDQKIAGMRGSRYPGREDVLKLRFGEEFLLEDYTLQEVRAFAVVIEGPYSDLQDEQAGMKSLAFESQDPFLRIHHQGLKNVG